MRIHLKDLDLFSQCPAKYFLSTQHKDLYEPSNLELEIARHVIQQAYTSSTETLYRAEWRKIIGWVDKLAFANIDITDEKSFQVGKLTSEHCLLFIRSWYERIFLKENPIAFINLPLEAEIGNHTLIEVAPIVKLVDGRIEILLLDDKLRKDRELHRNFWSRGLAFLLSLHLVEDQISVVQLTIGKEGGFQVFDMKTRIQDHVRIKNTLIDTMNAFAKGHKYQSLGEQCNTCIYRSRCIF